MPLQLHNQMAEPLEERGICQARLGACTRLLASSVCIIDVLICVCSKDWLVDRSKWT